MTPPPSRLSKADRQARIVAELRSTPTLRVNDLASRLAVSTETVRRDLAELDGAGLISRTYGGAMTTVQNEPGLAVRETLNVAERQEIARSAARLVRSGDILMIGGGATTLHFARQLATEAENLTVITHAFSIAAALASNASHRILMLPGIYDGREGLIHGAETVEALGSLHANAAFLGSSGLTEEGPGEAAIGPALVYAAMARRAARVVVLADHAKFDSHALKTYAAWNDRMALVTDRAPGAQLAQALRRAGTSCLCG